MKQCIAIASHRGSPWLPDCINSIPSIFPTIVVRAEPYEAGTLRHLVENTNYDRFLLLQDSTMVKDASWLHECWESPDSIALNGEPYPPGSYMAFYRMDILRHIGVPATPDKMSAVLMEMEFAKSYVAAIGGHIRILWPKFTMDCAVPEFRHGRENMRYENEFFIKWKGTWNGDGITPAQNRDDENRRLYP